MLNIADLYRKAKDYDSVFKYFGQAGVTGNLDPELMVSVYNNRAMTYQEIGQYREAQKQFRSALVVARNLKSPSLVAQILRNLASCQLAQDELPAAQHSIDESLAIARRVHLPEDPIMLSVMARAALQGHDTAEARNLIDRAFAGIDINHSTLSLGDAHQTAYEVYRAVGRPDLALIHLAALKRVDDEATKLATTTSTALMAARFDFAKIKADELQRSIGYERQQAKTERFAFVVTSVAAAIVMLLLAFALVTSPPQPPARRCGQRGPGADEHRAR